MAKRQKTLFFIKGQKPDAAELEKGKALGAYFRNTTLAGGALEQCDRVAGAVPEQYKKAKGIEVIEPQEPKAEKPKFPKPKKAESPLD